MLMTPQRLLIAQMLSGSAEACRFLGEPSLVEVAECLDNGYPLFDEALGGEVSLVGGSINYSNLFCHEELWMAALDPTNGLKILAGVLEWLAIRIHEPDSSPDSIYETYSGIVGQAEEAGGYSWDWLKSLDDGFEKWRTAKGKLRDVLYKMIEFGWTNKLSWEETGNDAGG